MTRISAGQNSDEETIQISKHIPQQLQKSNATALEDSDQLKEIADEQRWQNSGHEKRTHKEENRLNVALSSQTDLSKISSTPFLSPTTKKSRQRGAPPTDPDDSGEESSLQIIFASAEVAPFSKTGGLGDVVGSLPFALAKRGHRVMVISPRYSNGSTDHLYNKAQDADCDVLLDMGHGGQQSVKFYVMQKEGVDFVFVDHPCFQRHGNPYGDSRGDFKDNSFRFALLSMAACEAPLHVSFLHPLTHKHCIYGSEVLFLANDWHTALIPVYLEAKYRPHNVYTDSLCVLAIHNLAHQGIESPAMFHNLGIPESHYGAMERVADDGYISMNILKGGLVTADHIITVSCMHAFDMLTQRGSMGLRPVLRLRQDDMNGIINGIDQQEWNPETDSFIPAQYSYEDLAGKSVCKRQLQKELGFRISSQTPLLGYIGRLDFQKGPDLLLEAVPWIMAHRCQVVMLGTGDPAFERQMRQTEEEYKYLSIRLVAGHLIHAFASEDHLAHALDSLCRCPIGSSPLVTSSLCHPDSSLAALRSCLLCATARISFASTSARDLTRLGTIPVAHATGGLLDTIEDFSPFGDNVGTGFLFREPDSDHLIRAIDRALETIRFNKEGWQKLQLAMKKDFSWSRSALSYERVFRRCVQERRNLHHAIFARNSLPSV